MKIFLTVLTTVLLTVFVEKTAAQAANNPDAMAKVKQAIQLEDNGKIDEAITLIEEAAKMDPGKFTYPYELAYAYSLKKDYKKAIDILEGVLKYDDVNDQAYQLIGNCYDEWGKSKKALDAYAQGLKKFPNSGRLYLETGIVQMGQKEYNKALATFEAGIQAAPTHSSNYYWAAKLFLGSDEKVWGMIYGEIFMNLERNTKRTAEISKLLFDTYKSQITFTSDTSMAISFSKNSTITLSNLSDLTKLRLPFGVGVYEPTMLMGVTTEKSITLASLNNIRKSFLDTYTKKFMKDYPVVLFGYQNEIELSGNFEAYNYWLLMYGDNDAFTKWQADNKDKWDAFTKWYTDNAIAITEDNKFYRAKLQ
jgi:tetratricopeptide (TPR) repeat protein